MNFMDSFLIKKHLVWWSTVIIFYGLNMFLTIKMTWYEKIHNRQNIFCVVKGDKVAISWRLMHFKYKYVFFCEYVLLHF
jgi:hypothetical protein